MFIKHRKKSKELMILETLNKRMQLDRQEYQHYVSLAKGYEGEILFDQHLENLQGNCLILNDLLLENNNTLFQIDSLIIHQDKLCFYEVKNYEGDYYYQVDKLFKKPNLEVVNPIHQLSRAESLLRQLLQSLGFTPQIYSYIIFINQNFTLYHAPLELPIIFPNQIHRHLHLYNNENSPPTNRGKKLATALLERHKPESPFSRLPNYSFDNLKKGITCLKCHSYSSVIGKNYYTCPNCGYKEEVTQAIIRTLREFQLLFPDEKITTRLIYEWCGRVRSKDTIRRILNKNFKKLNNNRWAYFE